MNLLKMESGSVAVPQVEGTVSVNVESVFNEGIIVAFNAPDGHEYRGALLRTSQCSSCSVLNTNSLANPLAFLHDHSYSDLHRYTKQISTKMPPNLLLHWNSVPDIDHASSPSSPHKLYSRTKNGKVTHSPPTTVVSSEYQQVPPQDYTWPYKLISSENQRAAKCRARWKLQERHNKSRGTKSCSPKENSYHTGRRMSTSSVVTKRQKRSPVDDAGQGASIDLDCAVKRPMSLPPFSKKVALKRLSIPVRRVPVRVRKKIVSDIDVLSSSSNSSSSTVDSAIDVSLSPPLNLRSKSL